MTARVVGWFLLVSGLLAILAAYLLLSAGVSDVIPALLMVYGVGSTLGGTLLLASPGRPAPRSLLLAVCTVLAVVIVGFTLSLLRPADAFDDSLVLGLPLRVAMVLYGVGLIPVLVLPWAYARAASRDKLDPDSLAAFVAECREARAVELEE